MMQQLRSAYVIARRDFTATVLSKAFIFFLLGPLFPLLLGGLFGSIGARVATQSERPTVAFVGTQSDFARYSMARNQLAEAMGEHQVVRLIYASLPPEDRSHPERILTRSGLSARAVLYGPASDARVIGSLAPDDAVAKQLRLIVKAAQAPQARAPELRIDQTAPSPSSFTQDRALTAQLGQMILFFLTILLSGMLLSQLIEEKSNKIIEVIAAAVPIDAMFVGNLFAMLAASVLGIVVWVGSGALLIEFVKQGGVATLPPPAVGWSAFLFFGVAYFAMNYLLLGAVFLIIGAQANTVREVQTLSMPVTFAQVLIFGFAATAIGSPNSPEAIAAAIFPPSSPMVMLARAAEMPALWPHVAALAWQLLWVVLILRMGAQLFRKTVLKSGPPTRWWKRKAVT
jgi:ABC-2 type transport system permease protein